MRPRHTTPDANQLDIEHELQQLGFWTYRTANNAPQMNKLTKNVFHPLDLLVLGLNRHTDLVELTLWEIKVDDDSSFTDPETTFINAVRAWFPISVPVRIATSVHDILTYYGWID